jgi:hypothetical protein
MALYLIKGFFDTAKPLKGRGESLFTGDYSLRYNQLS